MKNMKKKNNTLRMASVMLLVLLCLVFSACSPNEPQGAGPTDVPAEITEPTLTEASGPRADSPSEAYLEAAREILCGKTPEGFDFDPAFTALYFGFDGDHFCSYASAEHDDANYESGYFSDSSPVERYPRSLGEAAQSAIARERLAAFPYYGLDPDFKARLTGFAGEDYIVVTNGDDLWHDEAVTCIFVRGADGEWREIGGANSVCPRRLTGACMLSENEWYLCFSDRYFETDGETGRRLRIFHTNDGGENWSDAGLELPEGYAEPHTLIPGSPVFEGEHGVILVTAYFFGRDTLHAWFETKDGGKTWLFVDPAA